MADGRMVRDVLGAADFWSDPVIAEELATRNVAAIYRFCLDAGLSQRAIAHRTGQGQPELCAILGGRSVRTYDVLVRIAEGLRIPRGRLGLAYDHATAEMMKRRAVDGGGGS